MSSFTKEPTFTLTKDGKFRLETGFRYYIGEEDSELYVDIPEGFETDFASIPSIFQWIFPPHDPRWAKAAIVHDYLYFPEGFYFDHGNKFNKYTRKFADDVFREAMEVLGSPPFIRWAFYYAVRIGGAWYKSNFTNRF